MKHMMTTKTKSISNEKYDKQTKITSILNGTYLENKNKIDFE